jgi:hypothetical protein
MKEFIYFAIDKERKAVKIGRTSKPKSRIKSLLTSNPFISDILVNELPFWVEQVFHDLYRDKRIRGEWFSFTEIEDTNLSFAQIVSIELGELVSKAMDFIRTNNYSKTPSRLKNRSLTQVALLQTLEYELYNRET